MIDVHTEQPLPAPGGASVTEALIGLIRQREAKGIATYGTSLTTWNGRDALRDALDEGLDQVQYLMQALMERDSSVLTCLDCGSHNVGRQLRQPGGGE